MEMAADLDDVTRRDGGLEASDRLECREEEEEEREDAVEGDEVGEIGLEREVEEWDLFLRAAGGVDRLDARGGG